MGGEGEAITRAATEEATGTSVRYDVAVFGAGLAARATARTLRAALGQARRVGLIETGHAPDTDLFYGTVLGPFADALHRRAGLDEGSLLRATRAAFSWGTAYQDWNAPGHAWVQAYHQPFAGVGGTEFHQHLLRLGLPLEPLLVSAQAGLRGVFAHPPADPRSPLSRAEYGYQVDPFDLGAAFGGAQKGQDAISSGIARIALGPDGIDSVELADGRRVAATLYVDATGPDARLLSALGTQRTGTRRLGALASVRPGDARAAPLCTLRAAPYGWQAKTPLRPGAHLLTVHAEGEEDEAAARAAHADPDARDATITLGRTATPWTQNCVGIGQASHASEPLTPAPLLGLYRDIARLLDLVPLSADQAVERREFNRRAGEDARHIDLFTGAFFAGGDEPNTAYRREGRSATADEKLDRKRAQWASRGLLVAFDLEPFTREDWLILHTGLGPRPRRYDRLADGADEDATRRSLQGLKAAIDTLTERMPPSDRYATQYLAYLEAHA